jgi:hypothetical protein
MNILLFLLMKHCGEYTIMSTTLNSSTQKPDEPKIYNITED